MKIRNSVVLAASAMLACSATVTANASCANLPGMKLTIKQNHIDLNDNRPVCIAAPTAMTPSEFNITIHNPPGGGHTVNGGDVTVQQKADPESAKVLISGSNTSPINKLAVKVELAPGESVSEGDEFEFWIKIEKVGMLDPRIRVVPSNEVREQQKFAVDETLDAWNLTYDEHNKDRP